MQTNNCRTSDNLVKPAASHPSFKANVLTTFIFAVTSHNYTFCLQSSFVYNKPNIRRIAFLDLTSEHLLLTPSITAQLIQKIRLSFEVFQNSSKNMNLKLIYIPKHKFPDSYSLHPFLKKSCFLCFSSDFESRSKMQAISDMCLTEQGQ